METLHGVMYSREGDLITDQLRTYSAHTRNELAMLLSFLREGDIVLDIGAHIGSYSLSLATKVGPRGKVFAFEPDPANYDLLVRNIQENRLGEIIEPVKAIVFSEGKTLQMITKPENSMATRFVVAENSDAYCQDVEVIRMDEWLAANYPSSRIRFIKIDTEGAELSVLATCQEVVQRERPILYCEVNRRAFRRFGRSARELERLLGRYGYHFFANAGERNSTNDEFRIARLRHLRQGGALLDCLAVCPADERYPSRARSSLLVDWATLRRRVVQQLQRFKRYGLFTQQG
jgi:FkbM family methyltransferase